MAFYDSTAGACGNVLAPMRIYFAASHMVLGEIPEGARHASVVRSGPLLSAPLCYNLPPVCPSRLPSVTVRISEDLGPEPFVFTIY